MTKHAWGTRQPEPSTFETLSIRRCVGEFHHPTEEQASGMAGDPCQHPRGETLRDLNEWGADQHGRFGRPDILKVPHGRHPGRVEAGKRRERLRLAPSTGWECRRVTSCG